MDSLITSAALALARGDFFGALNRVALREDAPALALRGIAMAQLGDLERAKFLLRKAARKFGTKQPLSKARCLVAEMDIALALRDLDGSASQLESAQQLLRAHGDFINAAYAQHLQARLLLLFGKLDEAEALANKIDTEHASPAFKSAHQLVVASIAIRQLDIGAARRALAHAQASAQLALIPSLFAEIHKAAQLLQTPAARLISASTNTLLKLDDVETLYKSNHIIVDACRFAFRHQKNLISLASRPILFNLLQALGKAWPQDVARDQLIKIAFHHKLVDETLRVRLRVEIGRLRAEIASLADVKATAQGFVLVPQINASVVVLEQPIAEKYSAIIAILADGEAWSSSALALVLGLSQRTVQRALEALATSGKVESFGKGQSRRWVAAPPPGVTTILLLPGPLPGS